MMLETKQKAHFAYCPVWASEILCDAKKDTMSLCGWSCNASHHAIFVARKVSQDNSNMKTGTIWALTDICPSLTQLPFLRVGGWNVNQYFIFNRTK